jgi:hypothetical protein
MSLAVVEAAMSLSALFVLTRSYPSGCGWPYVGAVCRVGQVQLRRGCCVGLESGSLSGLVAMSCCRLCV